MSNNELPEVVACLKCKCELELSDEEKSTRIVFCPDCEIQLDFNCDPPIIIVKDNYVSVISSLNQGDIALIKSILDDGEIDYYILGENFLGVRPLLEPAKVYVNENQIEIVKELLKDFELHIFGVSTNQTEE